MSPSGCSPAGATSRRIHFARGSAPRTPRWVQAFGIVALILIVLFAVQLILGGRHGPGMHAPSSDAGSPAAPSSIAESIADAGGPADPDEADRTVEVATLDSMAFEPSRIDVSAGETVTFIVQTPAWPSTNSRAETRRCSRNTPTPWPICRMGWSTTYPTASPCRPGETKQLTWQFSNSGTVEYACHEPGHYQAGMRGQVTVG